MTRIKILHVLTVTAGGLGQSVLSIVTGLDPARFDVAVCFGPGYPMDRRFTDAKIRTIPVRMARGLHPKNLLGFWDVYALLRRERFDIVHAHSSIAGVIARVAARLARVPLIVFTLHGYATLDYRRTWLRPVLWAVEKALDRCTDHYAAICRYVEHMWIVRGIVAPERMTVIYNGVDPEAVVRPVDTAALRRAIGVPREAPVIGTIGLLERQKGTEYLIRAMPAITEAFPDCHAVILGNGPLRERLEALARELGVASRVHCLGWRHDATDLLAVMDIFCLPSLREGFSVALLEAMAYAKPIVATAVAGNPEAVVDGETGWLIPSADPEALAKAVLYGLRHSDVAIEMGRRGRARLMERFTVNGMQRAYSGLYERLVEAGRIG